MVMEEASSDSTIPLDEVLGEAEAKYGPMPPCLRSILLPPQQRLPDLSSPDTCLGVTPSSEDGAGLDGGEVSLDDIALVPTSTPSPGATDAGTIGETTFLEEDHDPDASTARRSPDSGCSMSEASAEDKISIASTVSSSDDYGLSKLEKQFQQLKIAMAELREQDVALARQLLIVYDYVEETKWFLENFEACDPRHSIACAISSTERRFSQNIQKRLSDFGLTFPKGVSSSGYQTPPWLELNNGAPKRHSRNISDGRINMERLRKAYHDNNNNNSASLDCLDDADERSHVQDDFDVHDDVLHHARSEIASRQRSPHYKLMNRRSVSSSFLEVCLSPTPEVETNFDLGRNSPSPTISRKAPSDVRGNSESDCSDVDEGLTMVNVEDRTKEKESALILAFVPEQSPQPPTYPNDQTTSPASTSSASSLLPSSSIAETTLNTCDTSPNENQSLTLPATPPSSSESPSSPSCAIDDPRADTIDKTPIAINSQTLPITSTPDMPTDDCSIYIDDSDDIIAMSPFEYHMTWLQEQDETLL